MAGAVRIGRILGRAGRRATGACSASGCSSTLDDGHRQHAVAQPGHDRWVVLGRRPRSPTAAFVATVLAHEIGHAVAARRYGVGVEGIDLWILGGVARLSDEAPTPSAEWRIAAAGPLVSVGLTAVLGVAAVALRPRRRAQA